MSFMRNLIYCNFISNPKLTQSHFVELTGIFISRYGIRSMVLKLGPQHREAFRNYEKHTAKLQAAYWLVLLLRRESSRVHEWQQMARTREKFISRNLESNPRVEILPPRQEVVYCLSSCIKIQLVQEILRSLIVEEKKKKRRDVFEI